MTDSIKLVIVGDGAVGKTSMLISYKNNSFSEDYVPTVFDDNSSTVLFENKHISLLLFDTAGQDEYDQLRPLSYPETDIFLIAFSLVSRSSLENVKTKWYPEIQEHAPGVPIILVGTKLDLREDSVHLREMLERNEDPVFTSKAERVAKKLKLFSYYECSAKTF